MRAGLVAPPLRDEEQLVRLSGPWETGRRLSEQNVDVVRQVLATWEGPNVAAVVRALPRSFEELPNELR